MPSGRRRDPSPAVGLPRTGTTGRGDPYLIRLTAEGDAAAVVELHDAVAAEGIHLAALPGRRSALEEEVLREELLARGGLSVVVEIGGRVVAHLVAQRSPAGQLEQGADLALIVAPDQRRAGLGRALIGLAMAWARSEGLARLRLDVFADNAAALSLYRSLGFQAAELRRNQALSGRGGRELLSMVLPLSGGIGRSSP